MSTLISMVPEVINGRQFEKLVAEQCQDYLEKGKASVRRSGVHAVMGDGGQWRVIPSRPDFEGVLEGPRPVEFDCKVCSKASFDLSHYRDRSGAQRRQLRHMYERAGFGVACFFLLHWNARRLKTKCEEAVTYAFPVHADMEFWRSFEAAEVRSLNRADCEEHGKVVPWGLVGARGSKLRPDLLAVF